MGHLLRSGPFPLCPLYRCHFSSCYKNVLLLAHYDQNVLPPFFEFDRHFAVLFHCSRVFLPIHAVRLEGMPRRYTNSSFLITSINKVIGLFLILTLCSTVLMLVALKTFFTSFLAIEDNFLSSQESSTRYPVK